MQEASVIHTCPVDIADSRCVACPQVAFGQKGCCIFHVETKINNAWKDVKAVLGGVQAPDIDSDLFVEVLGILVNVDIPSYDWPALIAKHDLLNLLAGQPHTHVHLLSNLLSHGVGYQCAQPMLHCQQSYCAYYVSAACNKAPDSLYHYSLTTCLMDQESCQKQYAWAGGSVLLGQPKSYKAIGQPISSKHTCLTPAAHHQSAAAATFSWSSFSCS